MNIRIHTHTQIIRTNNQKNINKNICISFRKTLNKTMINYKHIFTNKNFFSTIPHQKYIKKIKINWKTNSISNPYKQKTINQKIQNKLYKPSYQCIFNNKKLFSTVIHIPKRNIIGNVTKIMHKETTNKSYILWKVMQSLKKNKKLFLNKSQISTELLFNTIANKYILELVLEDNQNTKKQTINFLKKIKKQLFSQKHQINYSELEQIFQESEKKLIQFCIKIPITINTEMFKTRKKSEIFALFKSFLIFLNEKQPKDKILKLLNDYFFILAYSEDKTSENKIQNFELILYYFIDPKLTTETTFRTNATKSVEEFYNNLEKTSIITKQNCMDLKATCCVTKKSHKKIFTVNYIKNLKRKLLLENYAIESENIMEFFTLENINNEEETKEIHSEEIKQFVDEDTTFEDALDFYNLILMLFLEEDTTSINFLEKIKEVLENLSDDDTNINKTQNTFLDIVNFILSTNAIDININQTKNESEITIKFLSEITKTDIPTIKKLSNLKQKYNINITFLPNKWKQIFYELIELKKQCFDFLAETDLLKKNYTSFYTILNCIKKLKVIKNTEFNLLTEVKAEKSFLKQTTKKYKKLFSQNQRSSTDLNDDQQSINLPFSIKNETDFLEILESLGEEEYINLSINIGVYTILGYAVNNEYITRDEIFQLLGWRFIRAATMHKYNKAFQKDKRLLRIFNFYFNQYVSNGIIRLIGQALFLQIKPLINDETIEVQDLIKDHEKNENHILIQKKLKTNEENDESTTTFLTFIFNKKNPIFSQINIDSEILNFIQETSNTILPLFSQPKEWIITTEKTTFKTKQNYTGGYYLNDLSRRLALLKTKTFTNNFQYIITQNKEDDKNMENLELTGLNTMQAMPYYINWDLVDFYIKNNFFHDTNSLKKYQEEKIRVELKICDILNLLKREKTKLIEPLMKEKQLIQEKLIYDIECTLESIRKQKTILDEKCSHAIEDIKLQNQIAQLKLWKVHKVYFSFIIDFRHRVYTATTFSPIYSKKLRGILYTKNTKEYTYDLQIFKAFCTKNIENNFYISNKEANAFFETTLKGDFQLPIKEFTEKYKEHKHYYYIFPCFFEYQKICELEKINQINLMSRESKLLYNLDATSSVCQVILLLLRLEKYLNYVNIDSSKIKNFKTEQLLVENDIKNDIWEIAPKNFYICFIEELITYLNSIFVEQTNTQEKKTQFINELKKFENEISKTFDIESYIEKNLQKYTSTKYTIEQTVKDLLKFWILFELQQVKKTVDEFEKEMLINISFTINIDFWKKKSKAVFKNLIMCGLYGQGFKGYCTKSKTELQKILISIDDIDSKQFNIFSFVFALISKKYFEKTEIFQFLTIFKQILNLQIKYFINKENTSMPAINWKLPSKTGEIFFKHNEISKYETRFESKLFSEDGDVIYSYDGKRKRIKYNARVSTTFEIENDKITDIKKTLTAGPANFIHSFDAQWLLSIYFYIFKHFALKNNFFSAFPIHDCILISNEHYYTITKIIAVAAANLFFKTDSLKDFIGNVEAMILEDLEIKKIKKQITNEQYSKNKIEVLKSINKITLDLNKLRISNTKNLIDTESWILLLQNSFQMWI